MSKQQHTPGPWFSDSEGNIWRRDPKDLYQNGGGVAGEKPLATVHKGWNHPGAVGYPLEANGRLIAAAPELLEALEMIVAEADSYTARTGKPVYNWLDQARSAIAKARGES